MSRKPKVVFFSAAIIAGLLMLGMAPASAGFDGGMGIGSSDRHHGNRLRPWYQQPPLLGTGPGLYYRYHYDHVPGHPSGHVDGYPVPIFPTYRPLVVYQPTVRYRSFAAPAHIEWCLSRYRSYRAYDNTFQPYHGGRKQCWSPYG